MNTTTTSPRFQLPDADRVGVAASVLCAIHCGIAPILLIALPTFGQIWAHPASHALVAIFIVPLAALSIRKGYKKHRKRWVALFAGIGILCVLVGAVLPALTPKKSIPVASQENLTEVTEQETSSEEACTTESCESCATASETASENEATTASTAGSVGCIDNCCPSAQISETGEITLHIPPAAIVTTLGGIFLISAHVGNIMGCRQCCATPQAA